ncbi:MAG: histidinol dehydrogenase [Thermodesulfobacteriota bacterium]
MDILTYPSDAAEKKVAAIVDRGLEFGQETYETVNRILAEVRREGDAALIRYADRFDAPGMAVDDLKASAEEFEAAENAVSDAFRQSLNRAAEQIEAFHKRQLQKSWITTDRPGVVLGQMVHPVDAAGVYVPGGKGGDTPLVSSVLMGAIPARIAGVGRVIMATPPTPDGKVNPHLLAAARRAGVDGVYKMGSAWAVAALTYGTETVPKCDVIVGPGNIYVTIAKKIVSGTVGIDMIAGPSEVLVIADDAAEPEFIAADLLSQAEHDPLASAVLVTDSREVAEAVRKKVKLQLEHLHRSDIARESLTHYGAILVVENIDAAIALSNAIAPEHLELHIREPFEHIGKIRNAGAVFMGSYTPEPVGDYVAGPNHVLPTAGTARFSSALSVDNFIKKTSILHYSESAFRREADDVIRLAEIEGLGAHANSIQVRMKK